MKILVVGSGGREHALAWRLSQSPQCETVYVAPGNPGTARERRVRNVPIGAGSPGQLLDFARSERIDLTVVGPEAPLTEGIADHFASHGLALFGPSRAAARLEGSKAFAKDFMARHHIPTAACAIFDELEAALDYVSGHETPVVIKADGLAAGKGVVVAAARDDAAEALRSMMQRRELGPAGARVVIEDFMPGEEASFIVMTDSVAILPLASSQDHKRVGDGDRGPNTGGMGAYSPAPVVTPEVHRRIMESIIEPAVAGMREDGTPYCGFLYAGLMIDSTGCPRVVEFNCRLGDPEAQPLMMRLRSDLAELCARGCTPGGLDGAQMHYDERSAVGVVLAASGYPGSVRTGDPITGLRDGDDEEHLFIAGAAEHEGRIVTSGGRVLCATALGRDVAEARARAYRLAGSVSFDGMFCRSDIASRAIDRWSAAGDGTGHTAPG